MRSVLPMLRVDGASSASPRLLLLVPDSGRHERLAEMGRHLGVSTMLVRTVQELSERLEEVAWGSVVFDYAAFHSELSSSLAEHVRRQPGVAWLVWSDNLSARLVVEAMKAGVADVMDSELDQTGISSLVQGATRQAREQFERAEQARKVTERFESLSHSERSVLSLVMQGRTNKEIASQLECSLRTVEARRHRILRVMETENAIDLAVVLSRNGLMDEALATESSTLRGPHFALA